MPTDQVNAHATIALIGSPNSGKTTLFNWLTGSRAKTVNYAGSTVDSQAGRSLPVYGEPALNVLDTPGIYSLQPHGRDEEVTLKILLENKDIHCVVVVVDATQLNRQLYLVRQMQEMGLPMVVALTMMDLVKKAGRRLDVERLVELVDAPVVTVDGRLGAGVADVVETARLRSQSIRPSKVAPLNWDEERIEREIQVAERWTAEVVEREPSEKTLENLRRFDRVLLHPVWGLVSFIAIMGTLFSMIFWLAAPLMDVVDTAFGWLAAYTLSGLGETWVADFVANGLVAGVGSVLVFVPQIFILFFGFTLLEDSGYLARAATIVDRPLQRMGLSGRAFVPLLSGFACAVPAIMAARNIRSARERWITVFVIPFMTCSARLPVYALLLTFLFGADQAWLAGLALTGLYLVGLVFGAIASTILNQILPKGGEGHFLMELPIYRWPKPWFVLTIASRRTASYVKKAGPTIFTFVLLLWLGTHLPIIDGNDAEKLQGSVVGQVGRQLEPVFEPMGLDWRAGLGIMSAFVAREVFVSSLAVIFNVTGSEDSLKDGLLVNMREATTSGGQPLFTLATVSGLLVFFALALQCLSTTGVTWREMGSLRYASLQLVGLNALAYVAAVLTVQTLRALGIS